MQRAITDKESIFIPIFADKSEHLFKFLNSHRKAPQLRSLSFPVLLFVFHGQHLNLFLGVVLITVTVLWFLRQGRQKKFFVRSIPGLVALDEAVGRATEMGRPLLFTSGTGEIDRMATLAALNILGAVAEKSATHNIRLIYPHNDPVVMAVAQEVVHEGCLRTGHPELFHAEDVFFATKSQFGYAAAVDGVMVREKPAANLYFGTFEGESLIFAETGNSIGAIQIAGTDSTIQLAFFLVACDYTLIGEELFVASGYLTNDPVILGSVRGQDYLKLIAIVLLVVGLVLSSLHFTEFSQLFGIQ